MNYSIRIKKRDYSEINLVSIKDPNNIITLTNLESNILKGFFNEDIVKYISTNNIELISRTLPTQIPGVIELYSKYKFKTNSRGVPSYIFIPLNKHYPKFLVNTKIKKKYSENQLITIKFSKWDKNVSFPKGELVRILGNISNISSIELAYLYELEIYPKKYKTKINISDDYDEYVKYVKNTRSLINVPIISIDPEGCKDIDDAFSLKTDDDIITIQVHISDVYTFLNYYNISDSIVNYSSIYLKASVIHMIPNELSTKYCSLLQKTVKPMITLVITINTKTNKTTYEFKNTYGKITKNYNYENYPKYIKNYYPYLEKLYLNETKNNMKITDSHSFIELLMILYNFKFTQNLRKISKKVIYRGQKRNSKITETYKYDDLQTFLNLITSNSANYSLNNELHTSLNLNNYTHATSPIRRIVDLINQELYYKKNTIFNKFTIDSINLHSKILKKFYRIMNKIILANNLYINGSEKMRIYIYDIREEYIYIYIPKYKINISYRLYNYKLDEIYTINYNDETKTILLLNTLNTDVVELKLNQQLIKLVSGNTNIFNIDKSLMINF